MKIFKLGLVSICCVLSMHAFGYIQFKEKIVKETRLVISEIQSLNQPDTPLHCTWHLDNALEHTKKSLTYLFDDDYSSVQSELMKSKKSLENLEYEGELCRWVFYKIKEPVLHLDYINSYIEKNS